MPATRTPTATCYLDGRRWYGIQKLRYGQVFPQNVAGGSVEGRDPPVTPQVGMTVSWQWGYDRTERAGLTGYVSNREVTSYPNRWKLDCQDVLWKADQQSSVLQTSPLNGITAKAAVLYLLVHYGGIPASKIQITTLPASGAAWVGSEWTLGVLTPVQWGDTDTNSGGTTALKAAAEICAALGYWLRCDSGGVIRATLMEKKPSTVAREVFERAVNLLQQGSPVRKQAYEKVYNQVSVRGANTGVDGAQLYDQRQTSHPLLAAGIYRDFPYSNFLLEYENSSDAGAASISSVATRLITVVSRIPDEETHRAKADPDRKVGDTVGLIDSAVGLASQKNYFIYGIDRSLDLTTGAFDDNLSLDGGTGSTGFTTVPAPDASFTWSLMAETLDGTAVVEVSLDGSASTSPTGEIVSYAWSTSTTTYGGTANSATGVTATFVFAAGSTPAAISLTVTDTTSKTGTFDASVDLTGADTVPPTTDVLSVAAGAAWYVTPDGGRTWNRETASADAIAVGTIGAGADDRAAGTAGAYGLVATRATGGTALRQTLDALSSASTNLVSAGGVITSNIWVNESNPARVWFAVGTTVYRSTDGGATKTAMATAPAAVAWIMEDAAVDDSVFLLAGANMYNATAPTVGWALLYTGPVGSTARQFVRSRDGTVTWVAYTGAPAGQSLQRVETGALADWTATDCRTLALDRAATGLRATLYGVQALEIWSFDGLTGLSAVQLTSTFPTGSTVQHMIGSKQFDLFYTADFDSITTGQGAVRKLIPSMDALLLFKQLVAGEQAHMLGLGGKVRSPTQILLGTTGTATSGGGVWQYQNGTWTLRNTGLPANWRWLWVSANPFNQAEWLILGNSATGSPNKFSVATGGKITVNDTTDSPLWHTGDSGLTWTEVVLTHPFLTAATSGGGFDSAAKALRVSWQTAQSGWMFAISSDDTITGWERRTAWWRGSGVTITDGPHTAALISGSGWQADRIAEGRDNDLLLMKTFQQYGQFYVAGGATVETLISTSTQSAPYPLDFESGAASTSLAVVGDDTHLWYSSDYRTVLRSDTGLTGLLSITGAVDGWYATKAAGLYQYELTPTTATLVPGTATDAIFQARADRQTRSVVAGRTDTTVIIWDTATSSLSRLFLPVGGTELSTTAIEPVTG